jgi:histidinol dehydrogenase
MNTIKYPNRSEWTSLIQRPTIAQQELLTLVNQVFNEIKNDGDKAVKKYSLIFDNVDLDNLEVTEKSKMDSLNKISKELQNAMRLAKNNIEVFHAAQKESKQVIETTKGVKCWRESRPIEKVGIYIPGGSAPLFSTVLMLGIPANLAACKEIVVCTPPNKKGEIHPAILFACNLVGVTQIFAVGGIQAIGAMAFGTKSIPKVDKIFGPGNQYVTAAKQAALQYGVAIDMPAGPSELLVIADEFCNPKFVATDLLSQTEHGTDSQVILLSDNEDVVQQTLIELKEQLSTLPRKEIAESALKNSKAIVLKSIDECIAFSNDYAPEHLILAIKNYSEYTQKISSAGSVFLGNYSCESAGDYASGTNHTLPTNGYAKNYNGVSLDSFVKKITFQEISEDGIRNIGPAVEIMAEAEELIAHKNAVTVRLQNLK